MVERISKYLLDRKMNRSKTLLDSKIKRWYEILVQKSDLDLEDILCRSFAGDFKSNMMIFDMIVRSIDTDKIFDICLEFYKLNNYAKAHLGFYYFQTAHPKGAQLINESASERNCWGLYYQIFMNVQTLIGSDITDEKMLKSVNDMTAICLEEKNYCGWHILGMVPEVWTAKDMIVSPNQSFEMYRSGALFNDTKSLNELCVKSYEDKKYEECFDYAVQAINQNNYDSIVVIAKLYEKDGYLGQNEEFYEKLLKLGVRKKNPFSIYQYGCLEERKSVMNAIGYYVQACSQNCDEGREKLQLLYGLSNDDDSKTIDRIVDKMKKLNLSSN